MTSQQVAAALGITKQAVTKAARLGHLTGERVGRVWTFTAEAVEDYRHRHQVGETRTCQSCGRAYHWHHPLGDTCVRCRQRLFARRRTGHTDAGLVTLQCAQCGAWFSTRTKRQRYCGQACRIAAFYARHPDKREALRVYLQDRYRRMRAASRAYQSLAISQFE